MRAVAEHLGIPAWSPCLLYKRNCEEKSGLPADHIFSMIDSFVQNIRDHTGTDRRVRLISLRTKSAFFDRVHDYLLPWFFQHTRIGTTQAIYFDNSQLKEAHHSFCPHGARHLYACDDHWIHFSRACLPSNPYCGGIRTVWTDIQGRLKQLRAMYPNESIDMVIIEGTNDNRRQGFTFHSRTFNDIVTLIRFRRCDTDSMTSCHTVALDDHRYEIASMTTDTMSWYATIDSLRVLGQSYAWLRFMALIVCCYMARKTESHLHTASVAKRVSLTIRTVLLIPSQVLVYGSIVPIACYSIAHLIDARFVNELVAEEFNTVQGIIDIKVASFFRINAVAMRSVWIVATLCHILLAIYVRRSWTPTHCVPGIPEFSIGVVVIATLFAHIRPRSARDTRLLEIEEIMPGARRDAVQSLRHNSQSHELTSFIKGAMLDSKCICSGAILVLPVIILLRLLHRVLPSWQKYRMIFLSRTSVPYCGGFLWHANAVVVTWDGTFIARNLTDERRNSVSGVLFALRF